MAGFDLDTAPDLAAIEEEGVTIHLRDAEGALMYDERQDNAPVTWTVRGSYSTTYRKASKDLRAKFQRRAKAGDDLTNDNDDPALAAECSVAFSGFYAKGQPLAFSTANAKSILMSSKAQHILAQVLAAMGNHERFFATGSAP